jgi:EpsI family protein
MIARCCILIVVLAVALSARTRLDAPPPVTTAESLARFPGAIGQWTGRDVALDPEVIKVAAVDDFLNRQYASPVGTLGLYVGYYQSQRQGESLHSPLFCLPGSGWQPVTTGEVPLTADATSPVVKELVVERSGHRLLVLYWYQTVKRVTGSEYGRKLFLMSDALTSGRTDVALVRIIAPIDFRHPQGEANALAVARPFGAQVLPELQARLFRE